MAGRAALVAAMALLLALGTAPDLLGQSRPTDELIRLYQARLARRPDDVRTYARRAHRAGRVRPG